MKRYFMIALGCILVLAVSVVLYGAWLNHEGENAITNRMNNRALSLQGERVQVRMLRPMIGWPTVNLFAEEMADAVARVDGVVQNVLVDRQSYVEQGQLLMQVQNEEIPLKIKQANSNIAKAQAEEKRAYNAYQRALELIRGNATSQEKLEEAEASYRSAVASIDEFQSAREQFLVNQSRQNITAPIAGDVLMLYRKPGTFVTAGTAVALIGDFNKLRFKTAMTDAAIRSMLPLEEMKEVVFPQRDFDKVYYTDYGSGNAGEEQKFHVNIVSVTPSLDVPAAMRYVVWEIDNSSGILEPQTYSNMYVQSQQPVSVLAVPLSAMVDQNHGAVYVWDADGHVNRRDVSVGADDGEYAEVLDGLQEGDIVIVSGTDGLESGTKAEVEIEEADGDGR